MSSYANQGGDMSDIVEQAREDAIFIGNLQLSRHLGTNSRRTNSLLKVTERLLSRLAEVEKERDEVKEQLEFRRDNRHREHCEWRGVEFEDFCPTCQGSGVRMYGSTTMWGGGIGGQMVTQGVCDKCWGSGSKSIKGADLREWKAMKQQITTLTAENAKMREAMEKVPTIK